MSKTKLPQFPHTKRLLHLKSEILLECNVIIPIIVI